MDFLSSSEQRCDCSISIFFFTSPFFLSSSRLISSCIAVQIRLSLSHIELTKASPTSRLPIVLLRLATSILHSLISLFPKKLHLFIFDPFFSSFFSFHLFLFIAQIRLSS